MAVDDSFDARQLRRPTAVGYVLDYAGSANKPTHRPPTSPATPCV